MQLQVVSTSDERRPYFWRIVDDAGQLMTYSSVSYDTADACLNAIETLRDGIVGASVVVLDGPSSEAVP